MQLSDIFKSEKFFLKKAMKKKHLTKKVSKYNKIKISTNLGKTLKKSFYPLIKIEYRK